MAHQLFKNGEYPITMDAFWQSTNIQLMVGIPALMAFQFHLLAQVDDACMWFVGNLKAHTQSPNQALSVQLELTKSCLEEQDAPWQMMLGVMNS
jgi:hypothetical protein